MTITVYTKPACVQCNATYKALDKQGIAYEKVDISLDNGPPALSTIVNFGESKPIDIDVTNVLRIKITILQKNSDCCAVVGIGTPRFA